MTTIKIKGINKVWKTLASGERVSYHYDRTTGTPLPGEPGSAEFLAALQSARTIAPRSVGNVSHLILQYRGKKGEKGCIKFERNRKGEPRPESTKKEYWRLLDRCEEKFGAMRIDALAAPRVIAKFTDWQEEIAFDHPREADNRLTLLAMVFAYARAKGRIARNPLERFERLYHSDRSDIIWLEAEILKLVEGAPIEMQRALILALHTGQRYGDLVRLRWADYDGVYIRLRQGKTGAYVMVKATGALKMMLDKTPKAGPYILTRTDGRPWFTDKDDKALSKAWRAHMDDTGLRADGYLAEARNDSKLAEKRLHFNDIRGTAVTMLAEAGCTIPEIVSITGHSLEYATKILEKYLSRTRSLSDAAILKFENSKATDFANRLQTREAAIG